jgi:hypothetical protein
MRMASAIPSGTSTTSSRYPSTGTKSGMRSIGLSAYATIAPANAFAYDDVRVSRQAK